MTAPNNNYVAGLRGVEDDNRFYRAQSAGPFNITNDDFAAFVLFWIRGQYQVQGAVDVEPIWLWGNLDPDNDTGWLIQLQQSALGGEVPQIEARVGDGTATVTSVLPLGTNVAGVVAPGYINRLILAALWYDAANQQCYLSVNGNLQPPSAALVGPYASSQYAPQLGSPTDGSAPAGGNADTFVSLAACGFTRMGIPQTVAADAGFFAGGHFLSAKEGLWGGMLQGPSSLDWVHRYEVYRDARIGGTVARNANGAATVFLPPAPTQLNDYGASGFANLVFPDMAANPVPLIGVDEETPDLTVIESFKNPDWYHGGGFVSLGAP